MGTICKVFFEFVTTPLWLYVLVLGPEACGIPALWPGIQATPAALEGRVLTLEQQEVPPPRLLMEFYCKKELSHLSNLCIYFIFICISIERWMFNLLFGLKSSECHHLFSCWNNSSFDPVSCPGLGLGPALACVVSFNSSLQTSEWAVVMFSDSWANRGTESVPVHRKSPGQVVENKFSHHKSPLRAWAPAPPTP